MPPIESHLGRWTLFVDGENFVIRAQNFDDLTSYLPAEDESYIKDVLIWFPRNRGTDRLDLWPKDR